MTGYDYTDRLVQDLLDVINKSTTETNSLEVMAAAAAVFEAVAAVCMRPEMKPPATARRALEGVRAMLGGMSEALHMEHFEPIDRPVGHMAPGPRRPQ